MVSNASQVPSRLSNMVMAHSILRQTSRMYGSSLVPSWTHSSAKKSYCYCRCRRGRTALALSATPVSMHRCEAWWGLGAVWKTSFRSKTVAEDAQAQARQHVARAQRMRQQGTEGARLDSISSSVMGWFRSKRGICVDLYGSEDKRVCTANKLCPVYRNKRSVYHLAPIEKKFHL